MSNYVQTLCISNKITLILSTKRSCNFYVDWYDIIQVYQCKTSKQCHIIPRPLPWAQGVEPLLVINKLYSKEFKLS